MMTLFKWLTRLIVGIVALAVAAAGLAYYLASHSLPDYNAEYRLDGLDAPIEIVRDSYAVPHVFAQTDRDVLFGLGFAHAQDRLWQMTMFRRTAQGRLSELFGEVTLGTDVLMRTLDIYTVAARTADAQSPQVKGELQAYADGVNAYLTLVREEALGRGAPEFFLFEPSISPWTPTDSIAVQKLLALSLTDMAYREVDRARLSLKFPGEPARVADLMPQPPGAVIALPEFAGSLGLRNFAAVGSTRDPLPFSPVPRRGFGGASNAFAAAPSRAAAGASLLASDPHLGLTAPGMLYLARLEFDTGGAIGATVPGIPALLIGRNADLGWGLTTSYLDDQDIYIERLNPQNPREYQTPDGFVPFRTSQSVIRIKDAAPRTVALRWTRHGPVLADGHFNSGDVRPEGHVASLAWTALTAEDRSIEVALGLMRSRSIDNALDIAALHVAPSLTLTLASRDRVALKAIGKAPRRDPGHVSQGLYPAAGWLARNDWDGFFPFADNPGAIDPDGGIVVNTNNRLTDAEFPRHWSGDWGDTHRIARATQLLNQREFHTLDSFLEVQTDTISPAARTLVPLIAKNLWFQGEPAAENTLERQRQIALEALGAWNGEMSQHSFEPLVFTAWIRALQRRLIIDELGPVLALEFRRPDPLFVERVYRDADGAAIWCDVRQSDRRETCEEMARLALDEAILELTERYGARIDAWRWGAAHQALHKHEVLGDLPLLAWVVNIRQETPGGDTTLLRGQTRGTGPDPYTNIHGSAFRGIYDFADPDSSLYVISTGQSGHLLSRHYDDQSLLWRRSEYIPMSLDPALARGGAVGVTMLLPNNRGQ